MDDLIATRLAGVVPIGSFLVEATMFNKATQVLVLGGALLVTAIAAGCASQGSSEPYSVTGTQDAIKEQARWPDAQGHYRPDWKAGVNRPPGYPKNVQ